MAGGDAEHATHVRAWVGHVERALGSLFERKPEMLFGPNTCSRLPDVKRLNRY